MQVNAAIPIGAPVPTKNAIQPVIKPQSGP